MLGSQEKEKDNDKETQRQKRKQWNKQNKARLAAYARNNYHRRILEDPEYRQKLNERVKLNRMVRMMNRASIG